MMQRWKLGLASWLVIGGAITSSANCALAQITPDGTLGSENSTVTSTGSVDAIDGGATRGANLFHSFQEFNVDEGRAAVFTNPTGIENILSRVTGANPSNILGTLGVSGGNANLFLINPNGIVFGAFARLNIGGSFVASTANALQFGNIGFFSATDQNIPSPLLTINPSALLFNQINQNAAIQNNSVAPARTDPAGFDANGLRVPDGKSLLLVGGNVSMDGGRLNAYGGRVELGGLAEAGSILLGVDADNLSLTFPSNVALADISLTNQAGVYVTGAGGGNIAVNARNLEILGGSILSGGIGQGLGTPETVAGYITFSTTGEILVAGGSRIGNLVRLGSLGNGGNITINASSLSLRDGARLEASTRGQGNAGNVTVRAKNAVDLINAEIWSRVEAGGIGEGGDIDIKAATLSLIDTANLQTETRSAFGSQPAGQGNAGDVNLNITGAIDIAGRTGTNRSGIFSRAQTGAVGNGGNITIDSGSLSLRDGARLEASTRGQGNAGNVTVRAKNAVDLINAEIWSRVEAGGIGEGGDIDIKAATLSLIDTANLQTETRSAFGSQPAGQGNAGDVNLNITGAIDIAGRTGTNRSGIFSRAQTGAVGNGGNITIDSGSLSLRDGARLEASTRGQGNAGNVTVRAKNAVDLINAEIWSRVEAGGIGEGGDIDIKAATLSLIDTANLQTETRSAFGSQPAGQGNAGDVNLNITGAIDIAGRTGTNRSGIFSRAQTGAVGNGGNITIDSGSLSLRDGAQLEASTRGQGNAGNVTVRAKNAVDLLSGASILSTVQTEAVGNGGNITINAGSFSLRDGAQLEASTRGQGNAGNVTVRAKDAVDLLSGASILSTVQTEAVGNGGNITINAGSFSLRDGAQLEASTRGQGNAGNVTVRAKNAVDLINAEIWSRVEAGGIGEGGDIDIKAATLSLIDTANLQTETRSAFGSQPAGQGNAGDVNLNITGAIDIAGRTGTNRSGIFSRAQTGAVGNGGNITIDSGSLSLRDGARLEASTRGQGNAGNVTVRAKDAVDLINAEIWSRVEAGGIGEGGDIDIKAATLSLIDTANLQTETRSAFGSQPAGQGNAGDVNLNITGAIDIAGRTGTNRSGIFSRAQTGAVGNGGNITIDSGSLSLRDGAQLEASTFGQGNAGNVTVRARDAVELVSSASILSRVEPGGVGKGGNISINAATLSLIDAAQLRTVTDGAFDNQPAGRGDAGNVNVNVTGAVDIAGRKDKSPSGIFSFVGTGTVGNAGNITINSGSFSLSDRAQLSAETLGQGNAGTIKVNAADFVTISANSFNLKGGLFVNSQSPTGTAGDIIVTSPRVTLDNSGTLNAQSASGNGGNINLQSNLLLLRRGAQISTTAGTAQAGGNGGNINIDAPSGFIVAGARENSDITANAFSGSGGRVTINAAGILGMTVRSREDLVRLLGTNLDPQQLPTNDIVAISQTSPTLSGQVTVNTPDIDPNSGLVSLPVVPVEAEVVQSCTPSESQATSKFVVTGRGGLPQNPSEILNTDAVQVDLITLTPEAEGTTTATSTSSTSPTPNPIVEAQGWVMGVNGEVVLTANADTVTPHSSWQKTVNCSASN